MPLSPNRAAAQIEAEHPAIADTFGALSAAGIGFVIIGSHHAEWAARRCGRKLPKPDDWDIMVLPEHFQEAVAITGATVRRVRVASRTGDGLPLHYTAHEARADVAGTIL